MSDKYEEKYTRPDLRREIKDELMAGDKGGRKGQWSARKSQMLVQEYEKHGGGYKNDSKDQEARNLEEWTEQNWQTADGSAYADDGTKMKRYLPERAWDLLDNKEKEMAKRKKRSGDKLGNQYVENTASAKAARAYVDHGDASELSIQQLNKLTSDELSEIARKQNVRHRSQMNKNELARAIREHFDHSLENMTKQELYSEARKLEIHGRSKISKKELTRAVEEAK